MLKPLIGLIVILQACTNVHPQDVIGFWSIDRLVEDGIDRTEQLPSRPWGTAIEFIKDGSFRTNGKENSSGTWKISQNGSTIFLYFQQKGVQYEQWRISVSEKYLVLKATTQQIYFSRTNKIPVLPPVGINLENNLPGAWYFYQMKSDSQLIQYPQKKRQARWMKIDKSGSYESGEGSRVIFRGRWILNRDTLSFSDFNRPWKKSWKVEVDKEGVLYLHTLSDDTAGWEQVSFINEANLP